LRRVAVSDCSQGVGRPGYIPSLDLLFRGCLSLRGFDAVGRARILHQLSRFTRAGPLPTQPQRDAAKALHQRELSTGWSSPRKLKKSIRHFMEVWCHRRVSVGRITFPLSLSASFGTTKAEGGLVSEIREACNSLRSRPLTARLIHDIEYVCEGLPYKPFQEVSFAQGTVGDKLFTYPDEALTEVPSDSADPPLFNLMGDFPGTKGVGPQQWELIREHLMGYVSMALRVLSLLRRKDKQGDLPLIRQVVIAERGMKCRMVTPIVGCLSYMGMVLNSYLLSLLKTDRRLDPRVERISPQISRWKRRGDEIFRSVDMTRATDLMPHDLVRAMVLGLSKGLGLPPFLRDVFLLSTGPHRMKTQSGWVTTCRGILMGSGVSWPLLSLYNMWLWTESWRDINFDKRRRIDRVRIVGDDLGGVCPSVVSDRYTRLLRATGGSPSYGKDLESLRGMVLLEELYLDCEVIPTIPVRALSSDKKSDEGQPPWAMGPSLRNLWLRAGSPRWLLRYIKSRYLEEFILLQKNGISPVLPREFGGGGFPTFEETAPLKTLRPNWVRAIRCAMSQGLEITFLSLLSGAWRYQAEDIIPGWEMEFWRNDTEENIRDFPFLGEPSMEENNTTKDEIVEKVFAVVSATHRLIRSHPQRRFSHAPHAIAVRLKERILRLNKLVPYPKLTDRPNDLAAGISSFLMELRKPVPYEAIPKLVNCMSTQPTWVQRKDPSLGKTLR
jgi:hypothetical protein